MRRALAVALLAIVPVTLPAQGTPPGRGGGPPAQGVPSGGRGAPRSPKAAAPVDLTGYWVSVISEDWRWRMVTPLKGDFASIPINAAGRAIGEAWDPAKDEAAGQQCRAYGAPAILRLPGRVHITWQDENTLKMELDAGTQTRLLHFDAAQGAAGPPASRRDAKTTASGAPSWQGYSRANWERPPQGAQPQNAIPVFATRTGTRGKALEVTTTRLRPGYLRKNGVPYSERAELTEYFDYHKLPNGAEWFTVTTIVRDPMYLDSPFITSSDFKKEPDGSKWHPTPCEAK